VTVAPFALAPAILVGLVLLLAVGWIAGVIGFVVVTAALASWARFGGDRVVAGRLGGRLADPQRDARLCNLVEGLSSGAGVRPPRIVVVDSPGLNTMAAGTSGERAVLAVTSALLDELNRMELEAVLAEELYLIRHHEVLPDTVVAATFGWGPRPVRVDRDTWADQGAISLTRYPPALASALEKMESKGAVIATQPGYMAHLWLADPRPGRTDPGRGRQRLHDRIEALREL
jgi:heat shock protein HtpX